MPEEELTVIETSRKAVINIEFSAERWAEVVKGMETHDNCTIIDDNKVLILQVRREQE